MRRPTDDEYWADARKHAVLDEAIVLVVFLVLLVPLGGFVMMVAGALGAPQPLCFAAGFIAPFWAAWAVLERVRRLRLGPG